MVLGFMVTLAVAVFVVEAVKMNNDMNFGLKERKYLEMKA